jgi:rfaE bifunctional protein kinase chain/domain
MKTGLIQEIIKKIKSVKIAVIGDFCLDAYWFINESRSEISIETGHLTRPVYQQKYSLGGAANVCNNLAAMQVKDIRAFGVIGNDPFGMEMIKIMEKTGINADNLLIQSKKWSTHVYIKPYKDDQEQNRIDFGNFNQLSEETADKLIHNLRKAVNEVNIIIINEQVLSGIHTEYFRHKLLEVINLFPDKIFIVDSRNFTGFFDGAYRKMNDTVATFLCGIKKDADEIVSYSEVMNAAKILYERYRKPLLITRGDRGSLTADDKGVTEIPGLMILNKLDTVGAGDSYLAGAASALAAGYSLVNAAETGTFTAGVTVQKLFQTGTATPEEILEIGQDPDFIYNPDLAEDIRRANFIQDTEIEIIKRREDNLHIKHVIFDHDGTISTLREGWELIMAPMMIKAILGDKYSEADELLFHRVKSRVNEFIDKTTGIQTLMQMKFLSGIIREFGFVPEEQILDEFGYKEIYNYELMLMVREREKKLLHKELSVEDFTIKNALPLLSKLYNSGIKLYLASGTDEEDVKNEASVLGYDKLFEGGIYGATGDITKEVKKVVLDRILDTIGDSNDCQIATFGDGPVEIRSTHKKGGVAIGVASNELRRYGLNTIKRTRLIKAGADIIIPDFSQMDQLLGLLKIK